MLSYVSLEITCVKTTVTGKWDNKYTRERQRLEMNQRGTERLGTGVVCTMGKLMFSLAISFGGGHSLSMCFLIIVDRMYLGLIPGYGNTELTGCGGYIFQSDVDLGIQCVLQGMGGAPLSSIQWENRNDRGQNRSLEILRSFWYYFL